MKDHKIDAGKFTQSDVHVVNEMIKNSSGKLNSDSRLSDITREKINSAWSNAYKEKNE